VSAMEQKADAAHVVTPTQAARLLGVGRTTVHRLISDGDLNPVGKGDGPLGAYMLDRADVEALAAQRRAELEARLARMGGVA